jgi:hypothetical protein
MDDIKIACERCGYQTAIEFDGSIEIEAGEWVRSCQAPTGKDPFDCPYLRKAAEQLGYHPAKR